MSLEIPVSKEEAIRSLYTPRRVQCDKCGEDFAGRKALKQHLAEVHAY